MSVNACFAQSKKCLNGAMGIGLVWQGDIEQGVLSIGVLLGPWIIGILINIKDWEI